MRGRSISLALLEQRMGERLHRRKTLDKAGGAVGLVLGVACRWSVGRSACCLPSSVWGVVIVVVARCRLTIACLQVGGCSLVVGAWLVGPRFAVAVIRSVSVR